MNNKYNQLKTCTRFLVNIKKVLLLFSILNIIAFSAAALTYTVTSNGDTHAVTPASSGLDAGGQTTLRSAMESATAIAGSHTIVIPGSITVINLTLGQITVGNAAVGNNITLNGPGKAVLTINQTTLNRIFSTGLNAVTFSMNDLTLNYNGPGGSFGSGGGAVQAGGAGASTSMTNVAITNFNVQFGNGGALLCSAGGINSLSLTNCDFTNNYCGGGGGAISYTGNSGSTCTITGCKFTNNKTGPLAGNVGGSGGAILTSGSAATPGTYTITRCTFTGNQTLNNTLGIGGGAISNAFGTCNVTYCRFVGNTAAHASGGNTLYESGGGTAGLQNINADNNWWGVNTGPAASDISIVNGSPAGVITITKWLQLKASASPLSICNGSASTVTASFLSNSAAEAIAVGNLTTVIGQPISFSNAVLGTLSSPQATIQASGTATVTYTAGASAGAGSANAVVDNVPNTDVTAKATLTIVTAPAISVNPSASTACTGLAASFSATATNQTSLVWQESATIGFGSPTTLSNTGIYSGATSGTLNISDNTTVNGKYYRLVASNGNGCGTTASTGALLTATTPVLSANNTVTQAVNTANNLYYAAACGVICKVVPSGASPLTGNVTSQVWVEGAVPTVSGQPFVQRHYQVTPGTAPGTATGTVTLYFSQAEFDNFNANPGSTLNLPTGSGDAAGKANLRIGKYSGSSGNGTGLPASYSSSVTVLDPPDANIVWNATFSRWEVSVDVTGFSGFVIQTALVPLPIKLELFTAQCINNTAQVTWKIAQPEEGSVFELQRSFTGTGFTTVNTQHGDWVNTQFNYADPLTVAGRIYYRLQVTDKQGRVTYSDIIFVNAGNRTQEITIYPNPVQKGENIKVNLQSITATKIEVTTLAGQTIWSRANSITGSYFIQLPPSTAKGVYLVKIYTSESVTIQKIILE